MEVFGAVGTAITLIQMTKNSLGRARRVGRGIDELRNIFVELMEIKEDVDPDADADLLGQIYQLVQDTRTLIEDNRTPARMSMKFLWTNDLDSEVQRINSNLSSVCRRLDRRVTNRAARGSRSYSISPVLPLNEDSLSISASPPSTHKIPRKPIGSIDGSRPRAAAPHRRRPSSTPFFLPTTLILRDADYDPVRDPIRLEKFSILDRDDFSRSRTIQYQSADLSIIVTHKIRYGTIPWTHDDLEAREVSFLENHMLTIETDREFAIYLLSPLYNFATVDLCNDFMARIRERTLVATFLPKEISMNRVPAGTGFMNSVRTVVSRETTLARCKLVRLWERSTGPDRAPLVTITFHDRSKHPPNFTEWSLRDFRERAVPLKSSRTVELSRYDRDEQFVFTFQTFDEAHKFATVFDRRRRNVSWSGSSSGPSSSGHSSSGYR